MTYVQGFVIAVPTASKDAYRDHAAAAAPVFRSFGATRIVEGWGDDVPDGKLTDFKGVVDARPDETVMFNWLEFPDRATCDAGSEAMMADPEMAKMGAAMPFDGKRMVYGGFAGIVEHGGGGAMGYADGFLVPVEDTRREAYRDMAERAAPIFLEHGATRVVEAWGDNVPEGKLTDFRRGTRAVAGESVVFSWVEWPSKEVRDAGMAKVMADERMKMDEAMPFDGKRMIFGGFAPLLDA